MPEKDETLEESGSIKDPPIEIILSELEQAAVDCRSYTDRIANVTTWWNNTWPGQQWDGRKHAPEGATEADKARIFPWDGCSDSRLHIADSLIGDHIRLSLAAFWGAKIQAQSIRPIASGRQSNVVQHMLDWRIYTHMKREIINELETALEWKWGAGLSFLGITWEQERQLLYVPITRDQILQLSQMFGLDDVIDKLYDVDKSYDEELIGALQEFAPLLRNQKGEAHRILNELRDYDQAELPIVNMRLNKPKWECKLPLVDVLFPSKTYDIQKSRWVNETELISEADLIDRIETEGYDEDFVDEALKHKAEFSTWMTNLGFSATPDDSDRDMVQLHHFIYKAIHHGVPCKYKLIFNEATLRTKYNNEYLYAVHRKFEYDHQQYPFVSFRRSRKLRPLLTSSGLAEEVYTDEWDIKRQQDGLNNRTDLIHAPPMVVPTQRAMAIQRSYGPRAVMPSNRPDQVVWQPLPPLDNTPVLIIEMVQKRLDRRFPIMGDAVDPEIKQLYRQSVANSTMGETEMAVDMTVALMYQYESEQDVQRVTGDWDSWQQIAQDGQGQHEVTSTVDMKMLDLEYAQIKSQMLRDMLPFRESGTVFKALANIADPDMADALEADQASPVAMEKETADEYSAVGQILAGMEARKPQNAMNQLRLQTIQQIMMDPATMQKVQQDAVAQKRLQNRIEYFQNQIQQYQQNPQIGRALSTTTFGNKAPVMSMNP